MNIGISFPHAYEGPELAEHHMHITISLSNPERAALERALYPGGAPASLSDADAAEWAEQVIRWRLREMVAGAKTRAVHP